jgi:CRISPR-associated endonuclease Csn1
VRAAGYAHHSDDRDGVQFDRLPYYGEVLSERLGTGSGDRTDPPELLYGRAPNPTVHVALNQLRHVVNALIEEYGPPEQIVVEVLRELGQSKFERERLQRQQKLNERTRDGFREELARRGLPANNRNLAWMRLWHEQAPDPKDRVCPYTGQQIGIDALFSGEVEEDHILPFAVTLDDSFNNRVLVMRAANRQKSRQTPYEAFGASSNWPDILERAKLLPPPKRWRFAPDALERWKGESGDFLARHLTDSAYLARLARLYLRVICHPDQVWCVPGRLTGLLRAKLGLHSEVVLGKGGARKDRTDHRHHAIDAAVIGLIDRSLLQRVATAARRAENGGHRLIDDLGEPWPGFVGQVAACLRQTVVSHKIDTSPQGRLHNDTAYGEIRGAKAGEPNVAHRVAVTALVGWSKAELDEAIADPTLRQKIASALEGRDKTGQIAALAALDHQNGHRVRRVRVRERLEGTAAIRNRTDGQPYKRVKLDANHRVEVWRMPPEKGKPGKVRIEAIPMLQAAADAVERQSSGSAPRSRPHPAAKLMMVLHKNDCVAVGVGEARRIMRVVKFRSGEITLADVHEGGALKARDADKSDPFRYLSASASRLVAEKARKVRIEPSGKIYDPGPGLW